MTDCLVTRIADPCDWPVAEAMLRAGFGDEDWFLYAFRDHIWQKCDVLLSCQQHKAAAMAALLPCQICLPGQPAQPALYLYALTTLPAHRGQGHARRLLLAAQARCERVFLHAEDASLHAFYQRLGWRDGMHARRVMLPAAVGEALPAVDGSTYYAVREALLRDTPHIRWDENLCCFAQRLLACEGGGLYASAHAACAVTGRQAQCLMLSEMLGDAVPVQALAAQQHCHTLCALTSCRDGALPLAQSVGKPLPAPLHLGFDFD